ncbi:MAG: hypothetical protein PHT54_03145 [Candidatus Nanoarchaeia archaeon]|nr:hypothetical protein [Candidatus Nanoarchaeia archaeon]
MLDYLSLIMVVASSLVVGYFIAYLSRDELKQSRKTVIVLNKIVIAIIILISVYLFFDLTFFLGVLVGYFYKEHTFYLGMILGSALFVKHGLLYSLFIFISGIFSGILKYKNKLELVSACLLFLLPITLYFLNVNLIPFAAGALIWSLK